MGVNLILRVINGVTPSRRPFFLIFFTSTFLQRDFKCTGSFLQRDGHFPQEKQYFLSFVGFFCPPKLYFCSSKSWCLIVLFHGFFSRIRCNFWLFFFLFGVRIYNGFTTDFHEFTTEISKFTTDRAICPTHLARQPPMFQRFG